MSRHYIHPANLERIQRRAGRRRAAAEQRAASGWRSYL